MQDRSNETADKGAGFWGLVAFAAACVAAAAAPPVRHAVIFVLTAPFKAIGAVLPGATPYDDAAMAAALLGWLAWALSPLALLPLLTLLASLLRLTPIATALAWATRSLAAAIDASFDLLERAVRWAALAMVAVVATIVVQRYVFGLAFTKLQEVVIYLHAALFMLVAAATLRVDDHVRVDVFYSRFGPRAKAIVNLVGAHLLLMPMCAVILRSSSSFVDFAWRVQERSAETDGLGAVFLLKTLIPVFAVILGLQGLAMAGRAALRLAGFEPGGERAPHDPIEGV